MAKIKEYEDILSNLNQKFDIAKFKDLDKELSNIIYSGRYLELLPSSRLENELDAKFNEMFCENKDDNVLKSNDTNIIKKFEILCKNNNKEFYLTKTFRAYMQMHIEKPNKYKKDNSGIDVFEHIQKYLEYTNKQYLMVNDRIAYYLINTTRIKRYENYEKIKRILKKFKEEYDISKYENIINNKISLSNFEFVDFIREVNKVKIAKGIIPFNICEYLIYEMLNPNSTISKHYKFWADLRECVFCDFISQIQISKYKMYNPIGKCKIDDCFNYVKRLEGAKGEYRNEKNTLCIDEDNIYNFNNGNVKAINTVMHELVHFKQRFYLYEADFKENSYEIYKEQILIDNIKNLKKKNGLYWHLSEEIEARREAIVDTMNYLKSLGCDIDNLKIGYVIDKKLEYIPLTEYQKIVNEECEKCIFQKEYGNSKLNFNKKISNIIKKDPQVLENNAMIQLEYKEDGTKRNIIDILKELEEAIINSSLSKESILCIFKYSVLNNFSTNKIESTVKKIVRYEYYKPKIRKMFLSVLLDIINEKRNRTRFIENSEERKKYETILDEQISYINDNFVSTKK